MIVSRDIFKGGSAMRALAVVWVLILTIHTNGTADKNSQLFFNALQQRLIADGFDTERVKQLYQSDQVFFETRGVSQYFMHNEASIDYDSMTKRSWVRQARAYMREQAQALQQAEKKFGVDPKIITAIILVETKFGRYLGKKSILNTLSTIAALTDPQPREYLWEQLPEKRRFERNQYDQKADKKAAWAYNELKAFLTYTAQHQIDPASVTGSYAGALGIAQFMPSNILAFGQDGNQDGRIDLFDDVDAIFSIANYLKYYGWRPGLDREAAYKVVYHYNHSSYYVNTILKIADLLKEG